MLKKITIPLLTLLMIMSFTFLGCQQNTTAETSVKNNKLVNLKYKNKIVKVNKNKPQFTKKQKTAKKLTVKYSKLDSLGRCGKVYAVLSKKTMPKNERESIGMFKPSGWPTKIGNQKYDFIEGKYVWNRSHLLGFQLRGNSTNNKKNLITGTRQLNADQNLGMLPYENEVANYLRQNPKNKIIYRVTPLFKKDELIARGVQMEAYSANDKGKSISFNIYIHNVQNGLKINYYTGNTKPSTSTETKTEKQKETGDTVFYLNINTKKFHLKSCRWVTKNCEQTNLTSEQLIKDGYSPCKVCHPDKN